MTEVVDRLQRQAADIRVTDRRATWLAEARGRRTALDARATALEAKRGVLVSRLGVAPGNDAKKARIASRPTIGSMPGSNNVAVVV